MKTIKILDNGTDRYTISANDYILGRMYDNEAEEISIEKPKSEANSICTMIITCMDFVVDHINVGSEPIKIKSNISQYEHVRIGFAFTRADGYVKNSEIKKFSFLEAQKPDGFIPVESDQKTSIEYLLQFGFAKCDKQGTTLIFYNANNEVVSSINLSLFSQEQADMAEDDETLPTYIHNKSTKYLLNEGEDGTSPYATEDFVKKNGGKIDSILVNDEELPIEDKKVKIKVPVKISDLLNDKNFISNTVDNLINYYSKSETYSKEEINERLTAIPKFKIQIIEELPTVKISESTIYLLKRTDAEFSDFYEEYIYINALWEKIGSTKIDLKNYYTASQIDILLGSKANQIALEEEINNRIAAINLLQQSILNNTNAIDNKASLESLREEIVNRQAADEEIKQTKADKTELPTKLSELESDVNHRTVSDEEKIKWNNKQDPISFDNIPTQNSNNPVTSDGIRKELDNKADKSEIPDVSGFITKIVNDLVNYYTKTSIDAKVSELQAQISAIPKFSISVVDVLPSTNISSSTIYLLKTSTTETSNLYTEYIYINAAWECLGTQKLDLTGYATEIFVESKIANFLTENQVREVVNDCLKEYSKTSDLAKIATSGNLSDAYTDSNHRLVTDDEKTIWNNKANVSDVPKSVYSLDGIEKFASQAFVANALLEAADSLVSGVVNDIMNGTYQLAISRLENIPSLRLAKGQKLSTIENELEVITAYYDWTSGKVEEVVGLAQFVHPSNSYSEVGTQSVEIMFIPAARGWLYKYQKIDIEIYDDAEV